jgi:hypothetical protein
MGLLIHEFGHYAKGQAPRFRELCRRVKNKGTEHHGLHFQAILNIIHLWGKEKGYWKDQLKARKDRRIKRAARKAAIKTVEKIRHKDPKSKIEMKKDDIRKVEEKIARYEKRLQYFTRLYGTKKKKARRSLAAHKRALKKMLDLAADR